MAVFPVNKEIRFKGLPLSPGIAVARVCLFDERRHQNLPLRNVTGEEAEKEAARFLKAFKIVRAKLESLILKVQDRVGKAEAGIFIAQKAILDDRTLRERVLDHIRSRNFNAEKAVISSLDFFESQLAKMDNDYIRERASDIGEVKKRLLDALSDLNPSFQCASDSFCQKGKNRIVVARELTPSLTMELNTDFIKGFVTERGGAASHAAILARALRIPAVSGIPDIHDRLFCGTEVLVNGDTGEIVIWPGQESLAAYPELRKTVREEIRATEPIKDLKVFANISAEKKINEAVDQKAEGIGLYRTEFEFFAAGRVLDENEQYEIYSKALKAMPGKPVYFRMLDLGGDKTTEFLKIPSEQNPALGFRGSRFLLGHHELFKAQARALARASRHGPVHVLYPMVIDLNQFRQLKKTFGEMTAEIPHGEIRHGLMFEVPSVCLEAGEIFKEADFGSIGTNDLIQYLFAVDRDNELVAYDHHPDRKVFWDLVRHVAQAAKKHRKPLSVCGEIAGNPEYAFRLMREGVRAVSVAPRAIAGLRIAVKNKPKPAGSKVKPRLLKKSNPSKGRKRS